MALRRAITSLAAAGLILAGCNENTSQEDAVIDLVTEDSGGFETPPGGWARIIPNTAFEGLTWLVIGIESQAIDGGPDLTGALVSVEEFSDEVLIREQACNRARCAIVIEVTEFMGPVGQPIPPPIEAQNVMLRIEPPSGDWMVATLAVFPLDFTDHFTDTMPLRLKGHYMMSSFRMAAGTRLEVNTTDISNPGRLFVAGPIEIAGVVDLSGGDAEGSTEGAAGLGAGAGGAASSAGVGPGAGLGGTGGGGGGGGSYGGTGMDGEDGGGTGGAAGASYGEINIECLMDPDSRNCAGSGGGGGGGAGGAGGSGFLLLSLDSITLADAVIDVSGGAGGDGASGGGGGSGGNAFLLAPTISGTATIDSIGGAGGASGGGAGGAGRIRLDSDLTGADLTLQPNFYFPGPVIDKSSLELIDTDGAMTVSGWAEPDTELRLAVDNLSDNPDRNYDVVAGSDGTFTLDINVSPGISKMILTQNVGGLISRGFVGNTFQVAGTTAVVGTILYIASVPDSE
ncbi:MAG: hypothetical protein JRG91_03715 [Deltaproteobacteria bacterium]|nr:hypothetical protein [Deltaproteobacteria bacterium]